jgi:hypothetical protein
MEKEYTWSVLLGLLLGLAHQGKGFWPLGNNNNNNNRSIYFYMRIFER